MDDTAELLKQINGESTVGRLLQSLAGFADPYLDKVGLRLSTPDELRHGIADTASAIPRTLGFADPTAPYQAGESAVTRGAQNAAAIAGLLPMPSGPQHPATPSAQAVAAHPGAMPPPVGEPQPMNAETTMKMYAGSGAKTADLKALQKATEMELDGVEMDSIRRETGWFIGPDGRWRFEIADDKAQFDAEKFNQLTRPRTEWRTKERGSLQPLEWTERVHPTIKLPEVFDHPDLYKAYPQLRDLNLKQLDSFAETQGQYGDNLIELSTRAFPSPGSVNLHEVQHAIQDIEGLAGGSSPERFLRRLRGERLADAKLGDLKLERLADNFYQRTMGEVEARDTQLRQDLTPEQRKHFKPYATQQIRVEDMIDPRRDTADIISKTKYVPFKQVTPPF